MINQVDILLSTYNGALYLEDFLRSIESQTIKTWSLIVRDDGSTDNCVNILNKFKGKYPNQVLIFRSDRNLGIVKSLNYIYGMSRAPYIMFADQDDVWFQTKIEESLAKIRDVESEVGQKYPIVVFSDKTVTDENLNNLSSSFFSYMKLNPEWSQQLKKLLVQNVASGCTMIVNRALLKQSFPVPSNAIMHDWWMVLVASALGRVGYLGKSTMQYRQHTRNSIGAKPLTIFDGLKSMICRPELVKKGIRSTQIQSKELLLRYSEQLSKSNRELIKNYAFLSEQKVFKKIIIIVRFRLRKSTLSKTLGFYVSV